MFSSILSHLIPFPTSFIPLPCLGYEMMFIPNAHCWNDNDSLMKTAIFSYFESFLALSDYRFGVAFGCMEKCKMYRNISCLLFTIEQLFGSPIFQTVFPLPQQQQRHNVHAFTLRFGRAHWMARRRWSDKAICQHFFVVSSNGRREERDSRERKKRWKLFSIDCCPLWHIGKTCRLL